MYAILELAGSVERSDLQKATQLRNQITDLMKELAVFKASLRKMESDQKDHLLNRLEDLQVIHIVSSLFKGKPGRF